MIKTSNVTSLSEKLKAKTEQDSAESRALILNEQNKLLNDLQDSYKQGLNTTLAGIQESLKNRLGQMALLTASEAQTLENMVQGLQTKHSKEIEDFYEQSKVQILKQVTPAKSALSGMTKMVKELSGSIESLNAQTQANIKASQKNRIWSILTGLSVLLTICAGSWGLIQYLSDQVQVNLVLLNQQQATLDLLKNQTLGVDLMTTPSGEKYVLLPPGSEGRSGFKVGDRSAVKF